METVCLMKRRIGASLPQKWYANCEHLFTTTRNKTYKSLCVHNFNQSPANCSACSLFYDILHATQACRRCFFFVFARLFGRVLPTTQSSQCSGAAASWVGGVTWAWCHRMFNVWFVLANLAQFCCSNYMWPRIQKLNWVFKHLKGNGECSAI